MGSVEPPEEGSDGVDAGLRNVSAAATRREDHIVMLPREFDHPAGWSLETHSSRASQSIVRAT